MECREERESEEKKRGRNAIKDRRRVEREGCAEFRNPHLIDRGIRNTKMFLKNWKFWKRISLLSYNIQEYFKK